MQFLKQNQDDVADTVDVSLVICTRNRLAGLERAIDAALKIETTHTWELVVVDNGSSDGTSDYLGSLRRGLPVSIETVYEPRVGLSFARNAGWRAARGDIVSFSDDDCSIASNFIDAVIDAFLQDPNIVAIAGKIYDETRPGDRQRTVFAPYSFIAAGKVEGANMSFRRQSLELINGFDTRLGAGTKFPAEDIDAFAALLWSGIATAYDPGPVVYHHHDSPSFSAISSGRKNIDEARRVMRGYDAGRGAYYAKYLLRKDSFFPYLRAWIRSTKPFSPWTGNRISSTWREFNAAVKFLTTTKDSIDS